MSEDINFTFRDIEYEDAFALLALRNAEEVRIKSRNSEVIEFSQHEGWLRKRISSNESAPFKVLEMNGQPVAYARLDYINAEVREISILVESNSRGIGLGAIVILKLIEIAQTLDGVNKLIATVHNGNNASIKLFEKIDFELSSDDGNFRIYEKHLK